MRLRMLGIVSFCVGFGMVLAIVVPAFGWALTTAIGLLCAGYFLARQC